MVLNGTTGKQTASTRNITFAVSVFTYNVTAATEKQGSCRGALAGSIGSCKILWFATVWL